MTISTKDCKTAIDNYINAFYPKKTEIGYPYIAKLKWLRQSKNKQDDGSILRVFVNKTNPYLVFHVIEKGGSIVSTTPYGLPRWFFSYDELDDIRDTDDLGELPEDFYKHLNWVPTKPEDYMFCMCDQDCDFDPKTMDKNYPGVFITPKSFFEKEGCGYSDHFDDVIPLFPPCIEHEPTMEATWEAKPGFSFDHVKNAMIAAGFIYSDYLMNDNIGHVDEYDTSTDVSTPVVASNITKLGYASDDICYAIQSNLTWGDEDKWFFIDNPEVLADGNIKTVYYNDDEPDITAHVITDTTGKVISSNVYIMPPWMSHLLGFPKSDAYYAYEKTIPLIPLSANDYYFDVGYDPQMAVLYDASFVMITPKAWYDNYGYWCDHEFVEVERFFPSCVLPGHEQEGTWSAEEGLEMATVKQEMIDAGFTYLSSNMILCEEDSEEYEEDE